MLGIVAQYHAQNSAATSIKGTIKKVEEHKAVGLLPLGLIQEKQLMNDKSIKGASRIVIDPDKAPIIKDIFLKFSDRFPVHRYPLQFPSDILIRKSIGYRNV